MDDIGALHLGLEHEVKQAIKRLIDKCWKRLCGLHVSAKEAPEIRSRRHFMLRRFLQKVDFLICLHRYRRYSGMYLARSPLQRLALVYRPTQCIRFTRQALRQSWTRGLNNSTSKQSVAGLDDRYFSPSRRTRLESSPPSPPQDSRVSSLPRQDSRPDVTRNASIVRRRGRIKDLPPDASSTLSALAEAAPSLSVKRRLAAYLALTKPRLAFLIVLTTTASYSLYPVPALLTSSATHAPTLSTLTLFFLTSGTFSTIAAANTLNMLFEPVHDAKMSRTRNRPLVRNLIRPRNALAFALGTAVLGTATLWFGVNPTTAILGATNIALYAFVYTPAKRLTVANTWIGAVVGAIPPLMGWVAAAGQYKAYPASVGEEFVALLGGSDAIGGYLLGALLFAWQFPHFNALSHPIRHEYAGAGYKMCVSLYPALNTRVALRYSLLMFPICIGLTYAGITDTGFVVTSSVVNGVMLRHAWRFWRSGGGESPAAATAARGLFWASIWNLPLLLVLAMVQKRGLWERIASGVWGHDDADEDDDDDEE